MPKLVVRLCWARRTTDCRQLKPVSDRKVYIAYIISKLTDFSAFHALLGVTSETDEVLD